MEGKDQDPSADSAAEDFDDEETVGIGGREPMKFIDIYRERPIRLTVRALVPARENPKVRSMITLHCILETQFYESMKSFTALKIG